MNELYGKTIAEMNWVELKEAADRGARVLLPLGVIEEHGPHLPLSTDALVARVECMRIRAEFERRGLPCVVAPSFHWGICQANRGFIGSFAPRRETVAAMLGDILSSLAEFGFREALGVCAHGDIENALAVMDAFRAANERGDIRARFCFDAARLAPFGLTGGEDFLLVVPPSASAFGASEIPDVHAGDVETAIVSRYHPELIKTELAKSLPPVRLPDERAMDWLFGGHIHELSPQGYLGDPANFENVDVEAYLDDFARRIAGDEGNAAD